jgi:hypothetical protein
VKAFQEFSSLVWDKLQNLGLKIPFNLAWLQTLLLQTSSIMLHLGEAVKKDLFHLCLRRLALLPLFRNKLSSEPSPAEVQESARTLQEESFFRENVDADERSTHLPNAVTSVSNESAL